MKPLGSLCSSFSPILCSAHPPRCSSIRRLPNTATSHRPIPFVLSLFAICNHTGKIKQTTIVSNSRWTQFQNAVSKTYLSTSACFWYSASYFTFSSLKARCNSSWNFCFASSWCCNITSSNLQIKFQIQQTNKTFFLHNHNSFQFIFQWTEMLSTHFFIASCLSSSDILTISAIWVLIFLQSCFKDSSLAATSSSLTCSSWSKRRASSIQAKYNLHQNPLMVWFQISACRQKGWENAPLKEAPQRQCLFNGTFPSICVYVCGLLRANKKFQQEIHPRFGRLIKFASLMTGISVARQGWWFSLSSWQTVKDSWPAFHAAKLPFLWSVDLQPQNNRILWQTTRLLPSFSICSTGSVKQQIVSLKKWVGQVILYNISRKAMLAVFAQTKCHCDPRSTFVNRPINRSVTEQSTRSTVADPTNRRSHTCASCDVFSVSTSSLRTRSRSAFVPFNSPWSCSTWSLLAL